MTLSVESLAEALRHSEALLSTPRSLHLHVSLFSYPVFICLSVSVLPCPNPCLLLSISPFHFFLHLPHVFVFFVRMYLFVVLILHRFAKCWYIMKVHRAFYRFMKTTIFFLLSQTLFLPLPGKLHLKHFNNTIQYNTVRYNTNQKGYYALYH